MAAKKKSDTPRNDKPVKIDAGVVLMAQAVAGYRDISVAEYVSEILRPIVAKDFDALSRKK